MGDHNNYVLSQAPCSTCLRRRCWEVPFQSRSTHKGLFLRPRLTTSQTSMYVLG